MGIRRHIPAAALVLAALAPGSAGAEMPDDPLRFFATCAGRLSAETRHLWLFSDPASDRSEALRTQMLAILDTLTDAPDRGVVLAWRIEARAAHGALRNRATFRGDAWAADRADRMIAECAAFVVGPLAAGPAAPRS